MSLSGLRVNKTKEIDMKQVVRANIFELASLFFGILAVACVFVGVCSILVFGVGNSFSTYPIVAFFVLAVPAIGCDKLS